MKRQKMSDKDILIKNLKEKNIPFVIIENEGSIDIKWEEKYNQNLYSIEEFCLKTGKSYSKGIGFDNSHYKGPKPKIIYEFKGKEYEELLQRSKELRSLQISINKSRLKKYYPKKNMSLNHKIIFALNHVLDILEKELL